MKIYDNPAYSIEVIQKTGEKIYYDIDQIQTNDHQTKSGIIDAFVDAVVNDHEPAVDGKSVLHAMRAVFASIRSSEEKRAVRIEERM